MSKAIDKPILLQRINETTKQWSDVRTIHARINKAKADNEYLHGGAVRSKRSLIFEVRYYAELELIANHTQRFRILYNGIPYNIVDYDDYQERHLTVRLLGESY